MNKTKPSNEERELQSGSRSASESGQFTPEVLRDNVMKVTGGRNISIEMLRELSPVPIPESRHQQAVAFLAGLFEPGEQVNILNDFHEIEDVGGRKWVPVGSGKTQTADYFATLFAQEDCRLLGGGGIFVRLNPVAANGTGKEGTYVDADVVTHRYALLEADDLSVDEQVSLFGALRLPIVSLTTSGRRSVHAIIKVACSTVEDYRDTTKALLYRLRAFGIDRANSNPSRFTRLPGALRRNDGIGDRLQRLLYLNPNADGNPIVAGGAQ